MKVARPVSSTRGAGGGRKCTVNKFRTDSGAVMVTDGGLFLSVCCASAVQFPGIKKISTGMSADIPIRAG